MGPFCLAQSGVSEHSTCSCAKVPDGLPHVLATQSLFFAECEEAFAPYGYGAGAGDGALVVSIIACVSRLWSGVVIRCPNILK